MEGSIGIKSAGASPEPTHYHRQACTECQRRKQKCSREWPCNHCQKRKVADQCTFGTWAPTMDRAPINSAQRSPSAPASSGANLSPPLHREDGDLKALSWRASELLSNLGLDTPNDPGEFLDDADTCPQLDHALGLLPTRQQLDHIVDSFFTTVNLHYRIINEQKFRGEYHAWWVIRPTRRSLSLQWTCLLLMVCACTVQQLDTEAQQSIEHTMGESAEKLSDKFHGAARELGSAIPAERYHINNVLWRLHSAYWFKAEAKFLEAWHVLADAVREGQELGLHREPVDKSLSPDDIEIRRRAWFVLDTWDWQMSSGLGRPTNIDRAEVDVALPNLANEEQPSPFLHMKLQSKLIREIAAQFGAPKYVVEPEDVQDYQRMIEAWMNEFPDYFKLKPTGKSWGEPPSWLRYHRYYLWTMAYLMILNPMRPYMAKPKDHTSSKIELDIFAAGLRYTRDLTTALDGWVNITTHRDGWFHFQIFSIFDVASMLCAAVMQDEHDMIPDKPFVLDAIDTGLIMLKKLNALSDTVTVWTDMLARQIKQLPRIAENTEEAQTKRTRLANGSPATRRDPIGSPQFIKEESATRGWTAPPRAEFIPAESDNPGLDGHGSASISPSSDHIVDINPLPVQPVQYVNDLQPQMEAFSQDLDWSFFHNFADGFGTENEWINFPIMDMNRNIPPR